MPLSISLWHRAVAVRRRTLAAIRSASCWSPASSVLESFIRSCPGRALELGPDVVDVGGGLLAVEDARADLDRLGDRLRAGLAGAGRSRTTRAARSSLTVSRSITRRSSSARTVPSAPVASVEW